MSLRFPAQSAIIGAKVIVRSNEDEPYKIGRIVDLQLFNPRHTTRVVVFQEETTQAIFFTSGKCILPYSDTLKTILDKMTPQEQLNFVSGIVQFGSELDIQRQKTDDTSGGG